MQLKELLISCVVIFIAVAVSLKLFLPARGGQPEQIQAMSEQLKNLESQMTKIQNSLGQELRALKESVARLESGPPQGRQPEPGRQLEPGRQPEPERGSSPNDRPPIAKPPMPGKMTAWMNDLSPEKRTAVEALFSRNAEALRAKLPQGDAPPDPDTLKSVMEESEQNLRNSMKSILSESEYQKFLESVPKPGTQGPGK